MSNIIEVAFGAVVDQVDNIRSLVDNDEAGTKSSDALTIHDQPLVQNSVSRLDC